MYFLFLISVFCASRRFSDMNKLNKVLKPFLGKDDLIISVEDDLYKFFNNKYITISLHSSGQENHLVIHFNDTENNVLPKCLGRFINLHVLVLQDNDLSELPDFFIKFTSLRRLDLSSNKFNKLPEVLFSLKELTHLYLRNNKFECIEDNIEKLEQLEVLDFSRNYITSISKNLKKLTKLKSLDLSYNPNAIRTSEDDTDITKDEEFLRNIPRSVKHLYFIYIRLRFITWDFVLNDLYTLNLRNNLLKGLSLYSIQCPHISSLDVSFNNLTHIPHYVDHMKELKILKLNNNNICDYFHLKKEYLTLLEELDLSYNNIEQFEVEGYHVHHLNTTNGEYTKCENLMKSDLELLYAITDENNSNQSIIYSLKHLSITITNTFVVPNLLIFPNLLYLKITNTNKYYSDITSDIVRSLFRELSKMEVLKKLELVGFNFVTIPEQIVTLQNLECLSLNSCRINEIPDDLMKLSNLTNVNLSDNCIKSMSSKLSEFNRRVKIKLDKNPLKSLPSGTNNDNVSCKLISNAPESTFCIKDNYKLNAMVEPYNDRLLINKLVFFNNLSTPIEELYNRTHEGEYKWNLDKMLETKYILTGYSNNHIIIINNWKLLEKYITDKYLKDKFSDYFRIILWINTSTTIEIKSKLAYKIIKQEIQVYAEIIVNELIQLVMKGNTKIVETTLRIIEPGLSGCDIDQLQHFSYAYHLLYVCQDESVSVNCYVYNRIGLLKYHALRKLVTNSNEKQDIKNFSTLQNRLEKTLGLPLMQSKYGINTNNIFLKCEEYIIYEFFKLMSVENIVNDLYEFINDNLVRRRSAYQWVSSKASGINVTEYVQYKEDTGHPNINITKEGIYYILEDLNYIKNVGDETTDKNI